MYKIIYNTIRIFCIDIPEIQLLFEDKQILSVDKATDQQQVK